MKSGGTVLIKGIMKKNIVLDLDGVISNISQSIDKHVGNDCDYSDWLITDSKDEQAMSLFNDALFWKNMKPYEDAWHQINYWFNKGIDVNIVTARRCPKAIEATQPWLDLWRINTMTPHFAKINKKYEVIKFLNPEFVVEDNPHEVRLLLSKGINAFLRKQWYNEPFWEELPTIETLYDLELE